MESLDLKDKVLIAAKKNKPDRRKKIYPAVAVRQSHKDSIILENDVSSTMSKVQLCKINSDLTNKNLKFLHHKGGLVKWNFNLHVLLLLIYQATLLVRSLLILQSWTLLIVLLTSFSKIIESLCDCLTATAGYIFFLRSGLFFFAAIRTLSLRSREFQFLI